MDTELHVGKPGRKKQVEEAAIQIKHMSEQGRAGQEKGGKTMKESKAYKQVWNRLVFQRNINENIWMHNHLHMSFVTQGSRKTRQ